VVKKTWYEIDSTSKIYVQLEIEVPSFYDLTFLNLIQLYKRQEFSLDSRYCTCPSVLLKNDNIIRLVLMSSI
jgi:hypothetical protein